MGSIHDWHGYTEFKDHPVYKGPVPDGFDGCPHCCGERDHIFEHTGVESGSHSRWLRYCGKCGKSAIKHRIRPLFGKGAIFEWYTDDKERLLMGRYAASLPKRVPCKCGGWMFSQSITPEGDDRNEQGSLAVRRHVVGVPSESDVLRWTCENYGGCVAESTRDPDPPERPMPRKLKTRWVPEAPRNLTPFFIADEDEDGS